MEAEEPKFCPTEVCLTDIFEKYEKTLLLCCFYYKGVRGIKYENDTIKFFSDVDPLGFKSPKENTLYIVKTNIIPHRCEWKEKRLDGLFMENKHTLIVFDPLKEILSDPRVIQEYQRKQSVRQEVSKPPRGFDIYTEGSLEPHTLTQLEIHLERRKQLKSKPVDRPFNKDIDRLIKHAPRFFPEKSKDISFEAFPIPKRRKR